MYRGTKMIILLCLKYCNGMITVHGQYKLEPNKNKWKNIKVCNIL